MIILNGRKVDVGHFPDGTMLAKCSIGNFQKIADNIVTWVYEGDSEITHLYYIVRHIQDLGAKHISLFMRYIPNARQDRVKTDEDIFTLKYFAEIINSLHFDEVYVLDPHSNVSTALIDRVRVMPPSKYIEDVLFEINSDNLLMFYPDEGSVKRYSGMIAKPYAFGIKRRNWETGEIEGLDISGAVDKIKGKDILIVDDICSRGGTFLHSAKKLKELGANDIYLYVSHCENTILEGDLLKGDLIKKVFTTKSIFTKEHEKIVVL